jgi:hypothetical protein
MSTSSAWATNGDMPGEIAYKDASQWATCVAYSGEEKTTTLFARQTNAAGFVTFLSYAEGEYLY